MRILIVILLFAGFSSCSDLNKSEHLKQTNDLISSMKKAQNQLLKNRADSSLAAYVNTQMEIESLKSLEDDTISLDDALRIDEFKKMYRMMGPSVKTYGDLNGVVAEELEALKKLKKDIERANGKRHKYDEYIDHEKEKVEELLKAVEAYVEMKLKIDKDYDTLYNEIKNFLVERKATEEVQ